MLVSPEPEPPARPTTPGNSRSRNLGLGSSLELRVLISNSGFLRGAGFRGSGRLGHHASSALLPAPVGAHSGSRVSFHFCGRSSPSPLTAPPGPSPVTLHLDVTGQQPPENPPGLPAIWVFSKQPLACSKARKRPPPRHLARS